MKQAAKGRGSMIDKPAIFKRVCEYYDQHYQDVKANGRGGCLYWMQAGFWALTRAGLKPQLQAGTAHWRIIPPEMDDGISATHFSFVWEPDHPASRMQLQRDLLPEIHCWLALIETNEIIDFSTHQLPDVARHMGFVWLMPPPPDFVWVRADDLPDGMIYRANVEAIRFVLDFTARKLRESEKPKGAAK